MEECHPSLPIKSDSKQKQDLIALKCMNFCTSRDLTG